MVTGGICRAPPQEMGLYLSLFDEKNKYWLQVLLGFSNFGSNSGIFSISVLYAHKQYHIQGLVLIMICINKAVHGKEVNQGNS